MGFPKAYHKLEREFFKLGNRVFIEFDNGLPPWGGVLDMPDTWTLDDYEASGWSAEKLLESRQTDRGRYFDQASPGYIFSSVIQEAKDFHAFQLDVGHVDTVDAKLSPSYHFNDLLYIAQKSLHQMAGTDFWVEPYRENGRILFRAHLFGSRGSIRQDVALIEGQNLASLKLVRQGPVVNWWDVAGAGSGWADERLIVSVYDEESIAQYGLRQSSKVVSDISEIETLQLTAENLLKESKFPRNRWSAKVANRKPALYVDYEVGDRVRLIAPSFQWDGFNGFVRVLSRNFDPKSGDVALVIEEVGIYEEVLAGLN
jgi:hypothetical protein